jgi:hypothetical protein
MGRGKEGEKRREKGTILNVYWRGLPRVTGLWMDPASQQHPFHPSNPSNPSNPSIPITHPISHPPTRPPARPPHPPFVAACS